MLSFGGVRAIDGLDLDITPGEVHGLIGPNGQRQDHDAERDLRLLRGPSPARSGCTGRRCRPARRRPRAGLGIARTFQTPRIVGEASVLQT